ncbi:hypothetical protein BS50DRAFT_262176 [Corynespora cassiicola Philippines]|uniref:Uncharacterized protein n=1 Tax=Corynespora cassiicola Philippines TaxID=1448308 RepID=A0A2T2N1D4_CORCC|nr:hypothetical protein BS50DRAFT_262176 [Corynespora cassiicola Philippines]
MLQPRDAYVRTLDSLLDAGDEGELLQEEHLEHVEHVPRPMQTPMLVVLPGILVQDCFHVAQIFDREGEMRIRYKQTIHRHEVEGRDDLHFFSEARAHVSSHWGESVSRPAPCRIRHTRDSQNVCTRSIVDRNGHVIRQIRHECEFMELASAADCEVLYGE